MSRLGDPSLARRLEKRLCDLTAPGRFALASVAVDGDRGGLWLSNAGEDSAFHIASVTKTTTALLLATLAAQGRIGLADPLDRYLGAAAGSGIHLEDLATHSAGLPRLPWQLVLSMLRRPSDPYSCLSDRSVDRALAHLARRRWAETGTFVYSNFGFGLLGRALAVAGGAPFVEVLGREVLGPLGLGSTGTVEDVTGTAKVPGHSRSGRVVPDWHNPTLAGCGCLWSTIGDVGTYLRANLFPGDTPLAEGLGLVHADRRGAGPGRRVGLGWFMTATPEGVVHWHNGGSSGFGAIVAMNPVRRTGVGVLIGRAHAPDVDRAALDVLAGLG